MAKSGGAREGAGRKPGSLTRRSSEIAAKALEAGISPLDYMLGIMRNTDADPKARAWAAEKAAPFLHPRPAPLERTVILDLPATDTISGIDAALDRVISAVASGDISPADGQGLVALIEGRRKAIETGDLLERIKRLEASSGLAPH